MMHFKILKAFDLCPCCVATSDDQSKPTAHASILQIRFLVSLLIRQEVAEGG